MIRALLVVSRRLVPPSCRTRDAMRRYLTKLFGRWDMTWETTEVLPLDGVDGSSARRRAALAGVFPPDALC